MEIEQNGRKCQQNAILRGADAIRAPIRRAVLLDATQVLLDALQGLSEMLHAADTLPPVET